MVPTTTLRRFIFLLAATLALPVAGLAQDNSGAATQRPPPPVTVLPVVKKRVSRQVTLVGSVEAVATSVVAAELGGVVAAFPAREGRRVKTGDLLVRLKTRELELELKGRVAERERIKAILPKGDAMTRTFPVRVLLDNPGFSIKAGMEALVTFDLSDRFSALMVPKDAVVTAGDRSMVYRGYDGRAFPESVTVQGYHGGLAAVTGELTAGDLLVIRGNERLMPGQEVAASEDKPTN